MEESTRVVAFVVVVDGGPLYFLNCDDTFWGYIPGAGG